MVCAPSFLVYARKIREKCYLCGLNVTALMTGMIIMDQSIGILDKDYTFKVQVHQIMLLQSAIFAL